MAIKRDEKHWRDELTRSADKRERFEKEADLSCNVYSANKMLDDCERRLSVWWYCVETLLPAYCSSLPKVEAQLRRRAGSKLYQVGARVIERAAQYALDEYFDFRDLGTATARTLILTGQAVHWVRYEAEIGEESYEYALTRRDDGLYTAEGEPYEGEGEIVSEDGDLVSMRESVPARKGERAIIDLLHYKDFRESVARSESEVEWRARRAWLSREKAEAMFGKDAAKGLSYDAVPDDVRGRTDWRLFEGKAEVWEIACRESGKIYHVSARGEPALFEVSDPKIEFTDGFPCCVVSQNVSPDSTVPIGDFTEAKDQILEVERLTTRIHAVTQAVRANFGYDATIGEKVEELLTGDLKGVPFKGLNSGEKIGDKLDFLPIDQFIKTLQVLVEARRSALAGLYETLKASDIMRGSSNPIETATAQELKSGWSSLGFVVRQNNFLSFISKSIEKLGLTMLQNFSAETLRDITEGDELLATVEAGPEAWEPFIEELRKEPMKSYRIEIAADSLVAIDEERERRSKIEVVQAFGQLLGQLAPMIEQYPVVAPYSIELLRFVLRSYKKGKDIEEPTERILGAMIQAAQAKQQAQQQTPPQPGVIEAQSRIQVAQINAQTDQAKMQLEQYKAELNAKIEQFKIQLEQARLQIDQATANADVALKMKDGELRTAELVSNSQIKQSQLDLQRQMKELDAAVAIQKTQNDMQRVQLETYEKLLEEKRLSKKEMNNGPDSIGSGL
jgi:hypothetical protein